MIEKPFWKRKNFWLWVLGILILALFVVDLLPSRPSPLAPTRPIQHQMNNIINQLNLFRIDCKRVPNALEELVHKPDDCLNWGPSPYLNKKPLDPWNHDFIYSSDGTSFHLKSLGADGKEGGTGENQDITEGDL